MQAGGNRTIRALSYQPRRPDDSAVRQRLRELAAERRRFGYRRLGWLLAREGHAMNHKKLYRLYREEKLMVRRRGGRKRALGTRAPMTVAAHDQSALVARLRFRHAERWPPLPHPVRSRRLQPRMPGHGGRYFTGGVRVVRELERLVTERGWPQHHRQR